MSHSRPANRLELLRNAQGLEYLDVAYHVRRDPNTVRRWEKGEVSIPDDAKLQLAKLFGVTPGFLMGWPEGNGNGEQAAA